MHTQHFSSKRCRLNILRCTELKDVKYFVDDVRVDDDRRLLVGVVIQYDLIPHPVERLYGSSCDGVNKTCHTLHLSSSASGVMHRLSFIELSHEIEDMEGGGNEVSSLVSKYSMTC